MGGRMTLVLVASSDPRLREHMSELLREDGHDVQEATNGLEALRAVFDARPDCVLVDLSIEEVEGLELVRMLRAASDLAILALMPPSDQSRGVAVLDVGADDVIRASIQASELTARLRASIRRSQREIPDERGERSVVLTGALEIDRAAQTVKKRGQIISLSRTEYRLLDALSSRVGQVAPHRFLLSTVWGNAYVDDVHYLRVYIGYLRSKLEDQPSAPRYLRSEWGVGYRLALLPVETGSEERNQGQRDANLRLVPREDV